ncbi:MAG: hypothetical protein ACJAY5_000905 [Actinomycetes bacterium]
MPRDSRRSGSELGILTSGPYDREQLNSRCQEHFLIVYLFAAPLFLIASYFIKDQRTKTAFRILAGMSLAMYFFSSCSS